MLVSVSSTDPNVAAVTPATIVLNAEQLMADVTVTTAEDDNDVIDELAEIVLSTDGGDNHHVMARVIDNDVQQIVADQTDVEVTESLTTTFAVRLAREPGAPVTLAVWSDAPEIASVSPSAITIDPTSYSVPVPITVTGVADANTASGNAHVYAGQVSNVTDARVDVSVIDDDTQALVLDATSVPLTEGTTATFAVSLAFDPLQPTTVQLLSSDPTATTIVGVPALQFDSSNYDIPQTVTLAGAEDVDQTNESVTVSLSGPTGSSVAVPVLDNDLIRVHTSPVDESTGGQFFVVLADKPGVAGMTATVDVIAGDVTVSPSSLFIGNGEYQNAHTFDVVPIVDYGSNNDRQATIRVSAPGQTPRDITFTIEDRIPGSLGYVFVFPQIAGAGATGEVELRFGLSNPWPADGRAVISFPPGFDASEATFVSSSVGGSYSIVATTSTVTVLRSGAQAGFGAVTLRLGNIRNPALSGTYPVTVATQTAAGDPLDSGSGVASIGSGRIWDVTATLGNTQPGATTTLTFSFTTDNPWPADGKLALYIPAVLDASAATVSGQAGVDGTLTASVANSIVTLTRSSGTVTAANTPISITLANVVTPANAVATGSFELVTQTSTGAWIDFGFSGGVVVGCPATMTKAPQRGTNVPLGGDAWGYPDGVTSPTWGTDVAYIQGLEASDYLIASDFQFTVPTGATIAGIQFEVGRDYTGYDAVDSSVRIVKSTIGQTEHASTALWTAQPVTYGGATDLWGETWTATDIESSTFGIALAAAAATPGMPSNVRVGYVTATVYLSCP